MGSSIRAFATRYPTALAGIVLLALLGAAAIVAPLITYADPAAVAPIKRLRPPGAEFWFGTDPLGRDLYSRVLYGARVSLWVGFTVALLSTAIGLLIGLVAGFNRAADAVLMRIMDGLMSIPPILLAIALMALTRASMGNVILAITIAEVPRVTRLVRSVVLTLREQPFVEAARAAGTRGWQIVVRHILPNCLPPLIVVGTMQVARAIALEATLSFLGLGVPITEPSLGLLISNGYEYMLSGKYWISFYPGIALLVTIVSINLVGDQLRDVLNPRLKR
jgi:peptide/nickel transport system permease protein